MPCAVCDSADERALIAGSREDGQVAQLTSGDAEAVRLWLESHQFQQVSSIGGKDAPFGDRQEVWECGGTLIRLTRDSGQWWYDISRSGFEFWLDVDRASAAMGYKQTDPTERVAVISSTIDDQVFTVLDSTVKHAP